MKARNKEQLNSQSINHHQEMEKGVTRDNSGRGSSLGTNVVERYPGLRAEQKELDGRLRKELKEGGGLGLMTTCFQEPHGPEVWGQDVER